MSRIYPTWEHLDTLLPPLTEGERHLAIYLDENLPQTWSIYVQPYLNNMRPDIVVMNPNVGIVVFEVKDWNLNNYYFDAGTLIGHTERDTWRESDPVEKAKLYAKGIYDQFLTSYDVFLPGGTYPNDINVCRPAVYFHCANKADVNRLYGYIDSLIVTNDMLRSPAHIREVVPYCNSQKSKVLTEEQAKGIRKAHNWLVPPLHSRSQHSKTKLTKNQGRYARNEAGFHRIRGAAGSGKTLILSHRAAKRNQDGGNILVLCFNITMNHVLQDLMNQTPFTVDKRKLTCDYFHSFLHDQAIEAGFNDHEAFRLAVFQGNGLARDYRMPKYDGIYIDEGQDFDTTWLELLACFLNPGGEFVLFADHKQNIYRQDGGRFAVGEGKRCRFRGRWGQLPQKTHRLPERVSLFLNLFANAMHVGDADDLEIKDFAQKRPQQLALDVFEWRNVDHVDDSLVQYIDAAMESFGNPNPGDVVILVESHEIGLRYANLLNKNYQQIVHVFGQDGANGRESKERKHAFWMGRGGLKMCTVHSFKGWELANVIVINSPTGMQDSGNNRASIFYTAVSRALQNIVVLNANRQYDHFADDWNTLA